MNNVECSKLFTPYTLKGLVFKNRLMRSSMVVAMADPKGFVTQDNLNLCRKAVEGGVGFVITGAMPVHPRGRLFDNQTAAWGDEYLPGLKKMADVMHAYGDGVVVWPQIQSGGAQTWGYSYGQRNAGLGLDVITEEDITTLIKAFADTALRVKRAGFDGVQLHGGHGYLIAQFLSPAVNHRTDKWGGNAENRMRFTLEIYKATREKVGDDFPIGIKMNTADYLQGGNWVDETSKIAKRFAEVGFDLIEMSGGMGFMTELRAALTKKMGAREYYFRDAIPQFREAVKGTHTALAACGGIRTPKVMEEILAEGVDFISLARPYLCEPDFANRVKAGDIRPSKCVSTFRLCNLCLTKVGLGSCTCIKFFPGDCVMTCPIGQDTPTYFSLIAQKKFEEAVEVVKRDNPLANVLSRVCHAPCETICRGETGEPLAIRDLKRFVTNYGLKNSLMVKAKPSGVKDSRGKVAIIGSGPAGLACGFQLAQRGYSPTIFEKLDIQGGMLAAGIPEYQLPIDILKADIEYVESAGVRIETGSALGENFSIGDLFAQGYKAIFLATGAPLSAKLEIKGSKVHGVLLGLDFLKDVKLGKKVSVGNRVAVVGGGNVAVDVAMTALRVGAQEATIVYRRSRDEMPAIRSKLEEAQQEGIKIQLLAEPIRFLSKRGQLSGIECVRMELAEPDASGRRRPVPIKGSEFSIDVDNVIVAIGETVDKAALPKELNYTSQGTVAVNPATLETSIEGVFAGGDVVTGPKTVVDAVAAGKTAAESIDRFIQGESLVRTPREEVYSPFIKITRPSAFADPSERIFKENSLRVVSPKLPVEKRRGNFKEICGDLNEEEAVKEAKRCLKYDLELEEKSRARMSAMGKATFVLEP